MDREGRGRGALDAPSRWDNTWYKGHDACLVKREPSLNQYRFYSEIPFAFSVLFFCVVTRMTITKRGSPHHHPCTCYWYEADSGVMSLESEKGYSATEEGGREGGRGVGLYLFLFIVSTAPSRVLLLQSHYIYEGPLPSKWRPCSSWKINSGEYQLKKEEEDQCNNSVL